MERLRLDEMPVIFKNFSGAKGPYNEAGVRTFSILVEDLSHADRLLEEGWALKPLKNEDGEIDAFHLPVKINYNSRQTPRIYKVSMSNRRRILLGETTVDILDHVPIEKADVIVNPYAWEVQGDTGIKAYCQTMYVVIAEDDLDIKWADFDTDEDSDFFED